MSSNRNIVITGFMGTGKTTVGRLVAEKLGRPFIDTDAEIVKHAGMPIPELFAQQGEANFRYIERRLCRFLAAQEGYVISTGGGMLVDGSNCAVMLASGMVVCLNATPEAVQQRLQHEAAGRPLLQGDWRGLWEQRRAAYAAIPVQIETTNKAPETIAQEIVELWQQTVSV
ncbi:MAG TPA: shikimate kinase [Phototrophicaceae bacterium]|nr:shikimate kinase [Phototrophicaceae bacterium]